MKTTQKNMLKYSGNTEQLVLFRVFFLRFTTKTGGCENVFSVRKTCILHKIYIFGRHGTMFFCILASCNFVTALQCDSSVWRVFLFTSKGKLFWDLVISLQCYSVTVPYGEYFCLHQKENCSWLRAISLQRYSVTVPF